MMVEEHRACLCQVTHLEALCSLLLSPFWPSTTCCVDGRDSPRNVGLPLEYGVTVPVERTDSRRSTVEEYLVAKGEAVEGRGLRRTDDVDETVDKPLGLPTVFEKEGTLGLVGKDSAGGGLLTRGVVGSSDEALGVSGWWLEDR